MDKQDFLIGVGKRLRKARKERGWTQSEFAKMLGVVKIRSAVLKRSSRFQSAYLLQSVQTLENLCKFRNGKEAEKDLTRFRKKWYNYSISWQA